jgi:hypothetical protein
MASVAAVIRRVPEPADFVLMEVHARFRFIVTVRFGLP